MTISLMPLPYEEDALEPAISAATLEVHYGRHHKAYVDKTNELVAGTDLAGQPLEAIIAAARGKDARLFNQAAQVWNHGFYWLSLAPGSGKPAGRLAEMIDASFGSHEAMAERLIDAAAAHFGSGWAWLVESDGKLSILTTHDADLPAETSGNPIIVVDVWEHAYYLDRKNDRKAYLKAATGRIDWDFASDNLTRGTRWTYPG
ncbi:MAG: superoxide dismutase [Novosphingobium sp.]